MAINSFKRDCQNKNNGKIRGLALRNLWKILCIDSIKLSDLEFIEVEVHKKKKMISNFPVKPPISSPNPIPQRPMSVMQQPQNTNKYVHYSGPVQPQQVSVPKKMLTNSRQMQVIIFLPNKTQHLQLRFSSYLRNEAKGDHFFEISTK